MGIEIDMTSTLWWKLNWFLCVEYNLTWFKCEDTIDTFFVRESKLTLFLCEGQKLRVSRVRVTIGFVSVMVVEIDLISTGGIKLGLI